MDFPLMLVSRAPLSYTGCHKICPKISSETYLSSYFYLIHNSRIETNSNTQDIHRISADQSEHGIFAISRANPVNESEPETQLNNSILFVNIFFINFAIQVHSYFLILKKAKVPVRKFISPKEITKIIVNSKANKE